MIKVSPVTSPLSLSLATYKKYTQVNTIVPKGTPGCNPAVEVEISQVAKDLYNNMVKADGKEN